MTWGLQTELACQQPPPIFRKIIYLWELLTIFECCIHSIDLRVVPHHVLGEMRYGTSRAHCYIVWCINGCTTFESQMSKSGLIFINLWAQKVE